jgi:hypothetical protein
MKSLLTRPSYEKVDEEDRLIQLSSRTDVLSKSFTTDLWMKVITRAIDDVALYRVMREQGKELKEEELEYEKSASAFLFNKEHRIPMDDYQVDITCPKCEHIWQSIMSLAAGSNSICPQCSYKTSWKFTDYAVTDNQTIKDISLEELIALWGVEDIDGFRKGCKRRIEEIVAAKLKSSAGETMKKDKKKREQMALPHMPPSNPNLAKPKKAKRIPKVVKDLYTVLEVVKRERERTEAEQQEQLEKAKELCDNVFATRAETMQDAIDSFNYIERIIEKHLNQ